VNPIASLALTASAAQSRIRFVSTSDFPCQEERGAEEMIVKGGAQPVITSKLGRYGTRKGGTYRDIRVAAIIGTTISGDLKNSPIESGKWMRERHLMSLPPNRISPRQLSAPIRSRAPYCKRKIQTSQAQGRKFPQAVIKWNRGRLGVP
jgi:hypothetical protein